MAHKDPALERLRAICTALPEVTETRTFGHPTFRAAKRTFAVLDEYGGRRCLAFKAELLDQQSLLRQPRFFPAPYGKEHGWTCLTMGNGTKWHEVEYLVLRSYRLVALKRMLRALDGSAPPAGGAGRRRRSA